MAAASWFKFFPSDWLAGTRGMSAVESGVYITLIAMMYDHGEPLTNDPSRLARRCGATERQFGETLRFLVEEGKVVVTGDNRLWNGRVDEEIQNRDEKSESSSEAAKTRWNRKTQQNQSTSDAPACETHSEKHAIPDTRYQIPDTRIEDTSLYPPQDHGVAEAVEAWNAVAAEQDLPKVQKMDQRRRKALKARLADCGGIEGWRVAMAKVRDSPFLCGFNDKNWRADFDFVIQQSSFTKLMEGKYDDRRKPVARDAISEGARFASELFGVGGPD